MSVNTITINMGMQVSAQWMAERRQTDIKMIDMFPSFQLLSVIHFEFKSNQAFMFCICGLLCLSPSPQVILQMQGGLTASNFCLVSSMQAINCG